MRADHLAEYNRTHTEVPTVEESIEIEMRRAVAAVKAAEIRISLPFVYDRDYKDVKSGRVIYPGDQLPFVRAVLDGSFDRP